MQKAMKEILTNRNARSKKAAQEVMLKEVEACNPWCA